MEYIRCSARSVAWLLVLCLFGLGLPAHAGMVGTEEMLTAAQAEQDRKYVGDVLQRDEVRSQLSALGLDTGQAAARVEAMTDAEVQALAGELSTLPAGGLSGLEVIAIIGIALIITDILGYTNLFTFVR